MDCPEVKDRIQDLLDQRLPADEREAVEHHLETCATCAKERDELLRTITLIRSLPRETAPAGFAAAVLSAAAPRPRPRGRRLSFPLALLASVAAAALILVAVLALVPDGSPSAGPETPTAHGREDRDDLDGACEVDARITPEDQAADHLELREEVRDSRIDGTATGHLEREGDAFSLRRADRTVVELRVADPRAIEGRLRSLLTASQPEPAGKPATGEDLARLEGGDRIPAPDAPAPAPVADAEDEPESGVALAKGKDKEENTLEHARENAARRSGRGGEPTCELILTRDQLTRLLAALDPEERDQVARDEAEAVGVGGGASGRSQKVVPDEADVRTLLAALRALRDVDGQQPVRIRLLGRPPAAVAGPSDAGR